ncbi:hypothetical protein JCM33374_g5298 [Metschnikowia sp. JCM 33374]|nr:hypothetical protein JCM33374_g5298 [Metschnikowia sp. JCM 33374]
MNLFLFPVVVLGVATSLQGVLYFITPGDIFSPISDDVPTIYRLGPKGNRVAVDNCISYVGYNDAGTLVFGETHDQTGDANHSAPNKTHVAIDEEGHFVLASHASHGFSLADVPGSFWKKVVSYKGNTVFQLCGDHSVAHGSECSDARDITIYFEPMWPFAY